MVLDDRAMALRVEWTPSVEGEIAVPFVCRHCAAKSVAVVQTKRTPTTTIDPVTGQQLAERIASFGVCPACGRHDEAGLEAYATSIREKAISLGIMVAMLGLPVYLIAGAFAPIPLFLCAGAMAGWHLFAHAWEAKAVHQHVRVLPVAEGGPLVHEVTEKPAPAPRTAPPDDQDWLIPAGVLALGVVLAIRFVGARPFGVDHDTSAQLVQFGICLGALGVIGWGLKLQWEGNPHYRQTLRDRTLVALGLLGFLGYFNFGHLHFGNFVHVWDTYHYVMASKYFPELGYEKMYDCAAIANAENGRRDEVVRQTITDLRTNIIVKTDEVLAHPERCKDSFSDARWLAYRQDIAAFRSFVGEGRWREIHLDHGYNATPVWTLAGYALTNSGGPVTMQQLTRLNLIDPLYLALTLAMIWWAFGPRAFAIAAIVLGCHFPNRYYWTGGAFLRHDWIFYFVASIALLKKNKPGLAGAAFAYTVLLRLFPGLAAAGVAVAAFEYFRQHKKLDPRFVRYVVGGVVTSVLLVGASFAFFGGPQTWQRFAQNTVKHANTPLTNHMGLRTVLSWRPDTIGQKTVRSGQLDNWAYWKQMRLANWQESKPLMWLTFLAGLFLVWLAIKHSGVDPWVGAALGTGFIVIGAELTNYYYCFLMGLAVLHEKRREVGAILVALSGVSHYLNWGPAQWMSHWLDEQYVTMSLAALFAVGGCWWVLTRMAATAVAPEEGPALLFATAAPAPAAPVSGKKKKAK